MTLEAVIEWLREYHYGKPGSEQNFAHVVGSALLGFVILKRVPDSCDERQREQMHRDYEACFNEMLCAFAERNSAYFRKLADGLDALKEHAPSSSLDATHFLAGAYIRCSERGSRLPTKSEVITMAKRLWAVARLTGCSTVRADIQYDQKFEGKIAAENKRLPAQKWSRHFKCLGLSGLPSAKPGPK
jgi:hypothetical protein